ncbi:LysB family phage lysis regulatory protein [Rosenbergiella epipactidis]|uniref:Phage lysis regulatory protein, LysB family n=1 Tax=Rosenbergiella nectarea TaxID=988801 RepID=A0A1H9F189_9GAMM|nr:MULTISPECIES: Rz-like lysis system protein LysB [Rosenbergiella]MBT0719417.1 LysB family phage lysis regulatory protein [Rosenbergiella epipactidis]SEQ31223.1 phage lysis regulatory protein, LysB family [Rosenbergiella nectarea]
MLKLISLLCTAALVALLFISWRLHEAHHIIGLQQQDLKSNKEKIADKNSQLIALSILTETNSQALAALTANAEKNGVLLRERLHTIEALTRENETLRNWAATKLPDDVIRLQQRPTFTRGEDYRQWLSDNHPLPAP